MSLMERESYEMARANVPRIKGISLVSISSISLTPPITANRDPLVIPPTMTQRISPISRYTRTTRPNE
jgi:hypothetical protein